MSPSHGFKSWLGILDYYYYLHLCASVTKQYNMYQIILLGDSIIWYRPRCVISLARKITPGLVESNGSQTLGLRWLRGTVVERRSLAGELSLSCARPAADG